MTNNGQFAGKITAIIIQIFIILHLCTPIYYPACREKVPEKMALQVQVNFNPLAQFFH